MDVFRNAFEQAICPQAIVDGRGDLVAANRAFREAIGLDEQDMAGLPIARILTGLPQADFPLDSSCEVEIRHGHDLIICKRLCTATPLPDGNTLLQLQPLPELAGWPYELIVDSIEEGITIRAEDGRLLASNRAARQMFRSLRDIGFLRRDGTPLPANEHPAMIALATNAPFSAVIGVHGHDAGNIHWLQVNCVPIQHPQAGRAVVSSFAEINCLLEIQERLAESEARFRAIFDHAFEFIGLLDTEGRLIETNATSRAFIGCEAEDVLGKHFADTPWWADNPDDQKRLRQAVGTAAAGGIVQFETVHTAPGGATVTVDFSLRPVSDADGTVRFLLPEGRDITHRKKTEQALLAAKLEAEAANLAKSSFLASTSHELRTPLNAVIGFSEVMMAEIFGPIGNERYAEYVRLIHTAGTHLRGLIEDILDVARIETGDAQLKEEDVDLRATLESVLALLSGRTADHHIGLALDLPEDLPWVYADPLRLRQIALNLIGNAIKFTPDHGQVRVSARMVPGWLKLTVDDTGIGIAAEHMESIWKPFFQADTSLARRYDGTGLGLPIVRHYVEAHGGTIEVHSTPGLGTTFTVLLPGHRLRRAANDAAAGEVRSLSATER